MVSSRPSVRPVALLIIASAEFIGPFLFGVAVAQTVGAQIVDTALLHITS